MRRRWGIRGKQRVIRLGGAVRRGGSQDGRPGLWPRAGANAAMHDGACGLHRPGTGWLRVFRGTTGTGGRKPCAMAGFGRRARGIFACAAETRRPHGPQREHQSHRRDERRQFSGCFYVSHRHVLAYWDSTPRIKCLFRWSPPPRAGNSGSRATESRWGRFSGAVRPRRSGRSVDFSHRVR